MGRLYQWYGGNVNGHCFYHMADIQEYKEVTMLTKRRRTAIEKITGQYADRWHSLAVEAFFAFTDKGQKLEVPDEAKADFNELLFSHRFHPVTVEMWRSDFKTGLLTLWDFLDDSKVPDSYVRHAFEIYHDETGYIPSCYNKQQCPL